MAFPSVNRGAAGLDSAPRGKASPKGHPLFVRVTHTLNTAVVGLLLYSGAAITIAHPRFYWGQSGNVAMPALFELPLTRHTSYSVAARNLHFAGAWACVGVGLCYLLLSVRSGHVRRDLLPNDRSPAGDAPRPAYNPLQKLAYLTVIFGVFPGLVVTGLAMSPALVSAFPLLNVLGGHQSARTLHFGLTVALVLFVIGHVIMVARAGLWRGIRAITAGALPDGEGLR